MKLIIEIPEGMVKALEQGCFGTKYSIYDLCGCVMNGTPLPKGHGRLIDAKVAYRKFYAQSMAKIGKEILDTVPTVIEADKGEEE